MDIDAFLLVEEKERRGNQGFALGGTQASLGVKSKVKELPDLSDTDVLILGMPLWAGTTPPAINTFLQQCDINGKKVYAFCTQQSRDASKKLERKLSRVVTKKGGAFLHLFVMRVPHGKQLSVEDAGKITEKWAERIRAGG
jgi:FMN-dependent NADH-azoreductase